MEAGRREVDAELLDGRDGSVSTTAVATHLGRRAASLSPARDALRRKGLIYSEQRGTVALIVPHFARFARSRAD